MFEPNSAVNFLEQDPHSLSAADFAAQMVAYCMPQLSRESDPLAIVHTRLSDVHPRLLRFIAHASAQDVLDHIAEELSIRLPERVNDRQEALALSDLITGLDIEQKVSSHRGLRLALESLLERSQLHLDTHTPVVVEPIVHLLNTGGVAESKGADSIFGSQGQKMRVNELYQLAREMADRVVSYVQNSASVPAESELLVLHELLARRSELSGASSKFFNQCLDQRCLQILADSVDGRIADLLVLQSLQTLKVGEEPFGSRVVVRAIFQEMQKDLSTWFNSWGTSSSTAAQNAVPSEQRITAAYLTVARLNLLASMVLARPFDSFVDHAVFCTENRSALIALGRESFLVGLPVELIEGHISVWESPVTSEKEQESFFRQAVLKMFEDKDVSRFAANAVRLMRLVPPEIRQKIIEVPQVQAAADDFFSEIQEYVNTQFIEWQESKEKLSAHKVLVASTAAAALCAQFKAGASLQIEQSLSDDGLSQIDFLVRPPSQGEQGKLPVPFELESKNGKAEGAFDLSELLNRRIQTLWNWESYLEARIFDPIVVRVSGSFLNTAYDADQALNKFLNSPEGPEKLVQALRVTHILSNPSNTTGLGEIGLRAWFEIAAELVDKARK